MFLITQHPNLIDNHVRRLVGEHNHVVRQFGLPYATIFRWTACTDNPQGASAKKDAISHRFNYPKKLYEQYRSATLHTHHAKLPWKVIGMLVGALGLAGWGHLLLHDRYVDGRRQAQAEVRVGRVHLVRSRSRL